MAEPTEESKTPKVDRSRAALKPGVRREIERRISEIRSGAVEVIPDSEVGGDRAC